MEIQMMSRVESEAWDRFAQAEAEYLQKFGEDSLNRVILLEPRHATVKEIRAAAGTLQNAIRRGKPLPQVDPELWESIKF